MKIFMHVFLVSTLFTGYSSLVIKLNTEKIINVVEDFFLSYCLDNSILSPNIHWINFNFSSPKLQTLMRELSPAILRLGGSYADTTFFDIEIPDLESAEVQPKPVYLSKKDLLRLLKLTNETGTILLLDLNLRQRYGYAWDPSQTIKIMDFIIKHNFSNHVAFELGNEPDWLIPELITPSRLPDDFKTLNKLMSHFSTFKFMVGPDIVSTDGVGGSFLKTVVNESGQYLKAATFHHYYFRGDIASYKEYINSSHFANLYSVIQSVKNIIKKTKNPNTGMWLGETSDAWHEGTPNVSDRFISSFLWLDKLGLSALLGVNVVMRQTFYQHSYAFLDLQLNPNPDYWLSWLYKKFVGKKVLEVSGFKPESTDPVRVYAHCTKQSTSYKEGAVTVYLVNVAASAIQLRFDGCLQNQLMHMYLAQAGGVKRKNFADGNLRFEPHYFDAESDLLSKQVKVNGVVLEMPTFASMPHVQPVIIQPKSHIDIPAYSYSFIVFPSVNLKICLE